MEVARVLRELVGLPSVTASEHENSVVDYILGYFEKTGVEDVRVVETPLEGSSAPPLKAVIVKVDAAKTTKRTIVLMAHFDVVDTMCYGELAGDAFDPERLSEKLANVVSGDAKRDLESGNFMFGRGVMDMKCGLAIELEILRKFAEDREMFDVNLVGVFVGDEENCSAGMRGVIPTLSAMVRDEGVEFLAAINTEPCEPGKPGTNNPVMFLGTIGKLLPAFYIVGQNAHVGNYYDGLSAALIASKIVEIAESNPELADPGQSSWCCLESKLLKDGYSVTVPDRAVVYFNCLMTESTPAQVMARMEQIARDAMSSAIDHRNNSFQSVKAKGYKGDICQCTPKVVKFSELVSKAGDATWQMTSDDVRVQGYQMIESVLRRSHEDGPLVVTAFLAPFIPARSDLNKSSPHLAKMLEVAEHLKQLHREKGYTLEIEETFTGICDLSYTGLQCEAQDIDAVKQNMPGWGSIYNINFEMLRDLDMAVMNLGPTGRDAHRMTERLETQYSLNVLPDMVIEAIHCISNKFT